MLIVEDYVVDNHFDLLAIIETWTKSDSLFSIRELCPKGLSFYRIPRGNRLGGGVGLLYRPNLKIDKQQIKLYSKFEYMVTVLRSKKSVTRIVILFGFMQALKMESQRLVPSFDDFSELLGRLTISSGKLLLLGDFNFHVDDPENDAGAAKRLDLLNLHNLS